MGFRARSLLGSSTPPGEQEDKTSAFHRLPSDVLDVERGVMISSESKNESDNANAPPNLQMTNTK